MKSGEGLWDTEDVQKGLDLASNNKIAVMSNDPIPKGSDDIKNVKNSIGVNSDQNLRGGSSMDNFIKKATETPIVIM